MNARAVTAWSAACMVIVLSTSNPAYKVIVLAAAFTTLLSTVGLRRMPRLIAGVGFIATFDVLLNFVSAHLGRTVLFSVPDSVPALGGPYTLEALAFGVSGGMTIAAAVLAAAPFSLLLQPQDVMDGLPRALSRTGTAIAASMNLVPAIARSFADVSEAQRLRGWRPHGPRSWAEVLVPVVLTSAESSIQMAESMEARGFASGPRTAFQKPRLSVADWGVVATAAAALGGFVVARLAGWAADWFAYPSLVAPAVDLRAVAICSLLFAPVVLWRRRV